MTYEIDKQNLTSYWIKKNVPEHVIQTLINHLKSFKFTIEELQARWGWRTEEDVINNHYMKLIACLFSYQEAIKGKRVLELGPGLGFTSYLYHASGASGYHGIEAYEPNIKACELLCDVPNWEFTHGFFEDHIGDVLKNQFDTLSLINIIEHMSVGYVQDLIKTSYDNFDYLLLAQQVYPYNGQTCDLELIPKNKNRYGARSLSNNWQEQTVQGSEGSILYYKNKLQEAGWKIKFTGITPGIHDRSHVVVCVK
jgi:hypothetical protein